MMYEFKKRNDELCSRSQFANDYCDLLIKGNDFDVNFIKIALDLKPVYDHFKEHVRNIYELIDTEIPLFALYELYTFGADNFGMDKEEYEEALKKTVIACQEYYY